MSSSLPINLIRQWCYCPRVVYYQELMKLNVEYPPWVKQGEHFHYTEEKLWKRRNLSRFNLQTGKKYHNLFLKSAELQMHGISDMAIETTDAVYAVEFKLSANNKNRGSTLQLVAYAMLLEEHFKKPSPVGFLVGQGKILHSTPIDAKRREEVLGAVSDIHKMLILGIKPDSGASYTQCHICEYINFCNDRL